MRRILLNRARDKGRLKRGGQRHRVDLEQVELAVEAPHEELVAIDQAIERLAVENAECARLVKQRFFAGLTIDEAAAAMGISASTGKRHWAYARAWFASLRSLRSLRYANQPHPAMFLRSIPGDISIGEKQGTILLVNDSN